MAKFRCISCNNPIELNKHRGFKVKEHKCSCGGALQAVYSCTLHGATPERIKTTVNNNYIDRFTNKPYYNAWRNGKHAVFIIDVSGKFIELTFAEHNNFDFR